MTTKHCISWVYAGKGVPGWDPYLGMSRAEYEGLTYRDPHFRQMLSSKICCGERIQPTGLADDPRLPPRAPTVNIVTLLQDAAARYQAEVAEDHQARLADWARRKSGTWAERVAAAKEPEPTLEEAKERRKERYEPKTEVWQWYCAPQQVPGVWHEWELLEIWNEQARIRAIDEAEARADAYIKSRYPRWGGGT